MAFDARARDLVSDADGTPRTRAEEGVLATLAPDRSIQQIQSMRATPGLELLVGARGGGNLRRAIDQALPGERESGTPLFLLLDDFAGASLVAPWVWRHWLGPSAPELQQQVALLRVRLVQMEGICTGFAPGATALGDATGELQNYVRVVPLPDPADPAGWHPLPSPAGPSMRRARRIDVWRVDGVVHVDAMFQDSGTLPDGGRAAVHEYTLQAQVDAATGCLTRIQAQPRVLPYQECPGAVHHLDRLLGQPLSGLRASVLEELPGTLGCTHLNDAMRALADVPALLTAG